MYEITIYVILVNLIAYCGVKLLEALNCDRGIAYEICGNTMIVFFPITGVFVAISTIDIIKSYIL